jgi:hypothetical protein
MICTGTNKRGTPCRNPIPDGGCGLCLMHDGARVEERKAHLAGMTAKSNETQRRRREERAAQAATEVRLRLESAGAIREFLERAALNLEQSSVGPVERANASARIASALLPTLKLEKFETRLTAVEAALRDPRRGLKVVP